MATGPTKDVKEFQFKVAGQLRVFSSGEKLDIENPVKLVATSSKYGLVFVGSPTGLISIISRNILYNPEIQSKALSVTSDFPRRSLPLPSQPSHLDVSADNELLAVAIRIQDIPVLQIYSVTSFASMNIVKKVEMRMSNTPGVKVADLQWNPGVPNMISAVMSDGSVVLFEIKDSSFNLNSLPPTSKAKCLCWSPKGKQVVIGSADGSLSQYKPDLKIVKTFPPPFPSASIVSVHWPSSFQFIAAYVNTATPHDRPAIVVVNVPKGAPVSYVRYDDVCFGSLTKRPEYYFIHQQNWNIVVVGCGDSMELSVLGLEANSVNWIHWKQEDSTRAELPLTEDKDDAHNLGIALDSSPSYPIQLNDSLSVGPMPIVISLSHDGVLCLFTALNLLPGSAPVCSPPQPFPDQSGLQLFTFIPTQGVPKVPAQPQPVVQATSTQPTSQVAPTFSQSNSMFSLGATTAPTQPTQSPQTTGIFSQAASSFSASPFGGQATFASAFTASSQPSSFPSSSLFSQSSPLSSKPPIFPSLTPSVSQAQTAIPPTVSQGSGTQSISSPLQPQPQPQPRLGGGALTVKPLLPTSSVPSFGLGQQSQLLSPGLPKTVENSASPRPTYSLGAFSLDSTQPKDLVKTEIKPVDVPNVPIISHPTPEKQQIEEKVNSVEIDNAAYMAAIYDELKSFQEEYTGVKQYLKGFKVKVGEEKVKGELCSKMDNYEEFSNELVETTQAQCAEVSSLRMSLLDIISWIQLIKTKQNISKNPSLIEMREAEEMDPIGKHWCKRIEQRLYGLQSQVKQAVEQIESIKNSNRGGGLHPPTFEAVLQTLIYQNKTINTQKSVISNIEEQLNHKVKRFEHRKKHIIQSDRSARNKMIDDSQLSKLAQKLLQTKLEASEDVSYSYRETSQKMMTAKNSSGLNSSKKKFLEDWHKKHQVIHTKVKPRPQSISDLMSPIKPPAKLSDKKPVSFTKEKVESPEAVMIKPVPTTPLSRSDNKTGSLSRNLFAENSVIAGVTPLRQDVKGMFQGGITSTPLPVIKNDPIQSNVFSPSKTISPPTNTESPQTTVCSPLLPSPKTGIISLGSVSSPSSQSPVSTSIKTATLTKAVETQPKLLDQAPKAIGFGTSPPLFSFGNVNKENTSSESQAPVSLTSASSIFSKTNTKASSIFGGLTQTVDNIPQSEDTGGLSFNFGSLSNSLKGSPLNNEKPSMPPKVDTSVTASLVHPFSFGGLSISTTSSATTTTSVTPSIAASPSFSFNPSSTSSITAVSQQTTTVSTAIKPLSSFSFGTVSSNLKPALTVPLTAASQTTSSFSFGGSAPPTSEAVETVDPAVMDPSVVATEVVIDSETPVVSSVPPASTQSSTVMSAPAPVIVSTPSTKSTVTSAFGAPTSAAPTVSSAVSTTASTSTTSVFTSPQVSFDSQSFKPPSTAVPAPAFGSSAFGSFTPATSASGLFGTAAMKFSTATTSAAPVFGLSISTASPAPLFSQTTTTSASPFGQGITSTQAPSSPFSQTSPTQSTNPSSPFSQPPTTTTSSFGASGFGSGSVFSSLSNSSFGGGSTFGASTTTQSVFGSPATTTTASSMFSTPLFGQTTPSPASPFGNVTGQPSPFSGTAPPTQAPASPFGASSPSANPFFNQSQPSVFGQASSQGNFGSSGGSIFGGSSSFGSTPQGGQFQSSGNSIFGGGGNAGGPFSSNAGQTVGQTGFGAPPSFQSPKQNTGAFGTSPVFGSSPSFGGAPAFGSTSSFGSPNKVFGATSPVTPVVAPPVGGTGGGFGGQTNMFESLANQNTMTFGNLAQNQQQPQNMAPNFGSPQQPQPTGPTFGGNAFSSWR